MLTGHQAMKLRARKSEVPEDLDWGASVDLRNDLASRQVLVSFHWTQFDDLS